MGVPNRGRGQITSRDLVITALATLAVALIIIVVIIAQNGRRGSADQDAATRGLIEQIKQQAAQEQKPQPAETPGQAPGEELPEEMTVTGTLIRINGTESITILDTETNTPIQARLTGETAALYNGSLFDLKDLYEGDQLTARLGRTGGAWEVIGMTIIFSASPETSAPVPTGLQERPDGTLKPL